MAEFEQILSSISALNLKAHGKYDSKLDFDQRCEILALHRTGVARAIIAEAYGLDRRTVTHIYNPNSKHYRAVRDEETKLGKEAFLRKYITENALNKLKQVAPPAKTNEKPKVGIKRSASKHSGVHMIKPEGSDKEHRIIIDWCEGTVDNAGAGWYYRDMDGTDPAQWLHNGDESRQSSTACLEAVRANLFDME